MTNCPLLKVLLYPTCFFSGIYISNFIDNSHKPFIDIHLDFDELDNDRNRRVPVITILSKKSNNISDVKIDQDTLNVLHHKYSIMVEKKNNNPLWNHDIAYRFHDHHNITSDQDAEIYKNMFKKDCYFADMKITYLKNGEQKIVNLNDMRKFD
jgi:hypothetical protein